jgi:integrase
MSIQKRGSKYRVRYLEGGKHRSRTFLYSADAQQFELQVKLRKSRGACELLSVEGGNKTLQAFGVQWFKDVVQLHKAQLTARGYADLWDAHILPELGGYKLRELTPEHIQGWITRLSSRTGPASLRKSVVVLQGCLSYAVRMRCLASNPVRVVEKPKAPKRKRVISPPDAETVEAIRSDLLSSKRLRDATLVSVLAYAGLRPGEALALRWADIEGKLINVESAVALGQLKATKTGAGRTVRLLAPLAADLAEWRLAQGNPPRTALVFPGREGKPWSDNAFRYWRSRIYVPAAERAGLSSPRPYDLRHSFASLQLRGGVNPVEVAEELGHSLATLLTVYSHVIKRYRGQRRQSAETTIRRARGCPKVAQRRQRSAGR